MRRQTGLTRIDVVVALACVALVLAQAAVLNAGGRERSKREVCLANLRMLTAAWKVYADDNGGKIVNGAAMSTNTPCPSGTCSSGLCAAAPPPSTSWAYAIHQNELPWMGGAWSTPLNECCQKCAITTGSLWKYTNDYNLYRCPFGKKDAIVTYSIIGSMNGMYQFSNAPSTLMMKNISQIANAAKKIVFIDEGQPSVDSYAVYYDREMWFDLPPVQHEGGVAVSFADGHSVYHKWKAKETTAEWSPWRGYIQTTCAGKNDLYWMQIGCWGQLGYTPSCPVNIE